MLLSTQVMSRSITGGVGLSAREPIAELAHSGECLVGGRELSAGVGLVASPPLDEQVE